MSTPVVDITHAPVRKTIVVNADPAEAFEIFTDEIDTWWPRTHHIGTSPMRRVIVEGRPGGRCYTEQTDDTECDWGTVLVWDPPSRVVLAWQITHTWGFEPDLGAASEVDVRFTAAGPGTTRVDLEHRHLDRHGAGGAAMRMAVDSPNGWGGMLNTYSARVASHRGGAGSKP